ncbi:MAG TPA: type II toxin-antitoxin system RelE/ParE family toxin [Bryobacteraceae bacterium]|nr:type II toxin-antitoxin system RelE/ParE family toxin [Bryobacteraceae bacterium]
MAQFRLSRAAELDLFDIGTHTLRTWGVDQIIRYLDDLEACCQGLPDSPELGRPCDHIRPGLRRMEQGKHVVFFRPEPGGVLVSRTLNERMLPERQGVSEEDDE